jgi:rSAM/selenodomain-associated transferase 1
VSGALVVFAKAPRPGAVKTRLCPPFTPAQAAALYACMLDDVLEASAALARRFDLVPVLAVHPPEAVRELGARAPGFEALAQRGPDLSARMENAAADLFARGHAPVLLRGSDSPCLGEATLAAALEALATVDVALCPDRDGGYGLVGLRAPAPGLFAHPMSTASVLRATQRRARAGGLRVAVLETGFDVDTAADLALLAEAREAGAADACPRTLAWLDARRMWPEGPGPGRAGPGTMRPGKPESAR